jgi:hypothetical protein
MGKYTALVDDHLILPARVSVTPGRERELLSTGLSIPSPVSVRLVIDTGSKRTTLTPGLLRHLRISVAGSARLIIARSIGSTELFWVRLEFPKAGLVPFPEILVARLPMPAALSQFHGLLGRDLLRRLASFDYEGRRGCYTIRDKAGLFAWLRRWL